MCVAHWHVISSESSKHLLRFQCFNGTMEGVGVEHRKPCYDYAGPLDETRRGLVAATSTLYNALIVNALKILQPNSMRHLEGVSMFK